MRHSRRGPRRWPISWATSAAPTRCTCGRFTRGLPRWLRESAAGKGLANASFAPVPTQVQFSSTLTHTMGDLQSFQVPIQVLADTILKPVTSEQFLWRNAAGLNWDPLGMLRMTSNWSSTRDLRVYDDSTTARPGRQRGASSRCWAPMLAWSATAT